MYFRASATTPDARATPQRISDGYGLLIVAELQAVVVVASSTCSFHALVVLALVLAPFARTLADLLRLTAFRDCYALTVRLVADVTGGAELVPVLVGCNRLRPSAIRVAALGVFAGRTAAALALIGARPWGIQVLAIAVVDARGKRMRCGALAWSANKVPRSRVEEVQVMRAPIGPGKGQACEAARVRLAARGVLEHWKWRPHGIPQVVVLACLVCVKDTHVAGAILGAEGCPPHVFVVGRHRRIGDVGPLDVTGQATHCRDRGLDVLVNVGAAESAVWIRACLLHVPLVQGDFALVGDCFVLVRVDAGVWLWNSCIQVDSRC